MSDLFERRGPAQALDVGFSPVRGVEAMLRPLTPADYDPLYKLELSGELGRRWRQKGATPSFEVWVEGLWRGVLAQFLVTGVGEGKAVGLVTVYNANMKDRWAHLAVVKFNPADRSPVLFHGLALFVSYVFSTWDFRKLYAEVSGYNLESFASAVGSVLVEEGVLRDHEYSAGRWWDQHLLALYRETWERWEPIVMPRVTGGEKFRQRGDVPMPTREWPEKADGS